MVEWSDWVAEIKAGPDDDIVKWRDGEWSFRYYFKDSGEEPGEIPAGRLGEPYEVFEKGSVEWVRLQEAHKLKKEVDPFGVQKVFITGKKFSDAFVENLANTAKKVLAIGDGVTALGIARQLRQVSRSSHATGEEQKATAARMYDEIVSQVDATAVVDDMFRVTRAGVHTDHEQAIALLREVTSPKLVGHAKSLIIARERQIHGRSVLNMRAIGEMNFSTTGDLKQEQKHVRALIREAKKSGDQAQAIAASQQLYRVGVILVLAWDLHMRLYDVKNLAERNELERRMRKMMKEVGSISYLTHGRPMHVKESCELTFLSAVDLRYLESFLGHSTRSMMPFKLLEAEGAWPVEAAAM